MSEDEDNMDMDFWSGKSRSISRKGDEGDFFYDEEASEDEGYDEDKDKFVSVLKGDSKSRSSSKRKHRSWSKRKHHSWSKGKQDSVSRKACER